MSVHEQASRVVEKYISSEKDSAMNDLLRIIQGGSFTLPMKNAIVSSINSWLDMSDPFRKELRYQISPEGNLEADTDPQTYEDGQVYKARWERSTGNPIEESNPLLPPGGEDVR
jgi:hypothetical protein